ncbi:hypothetical protein BGZ80_005155 [Entomortierella chlamydospora]|uniref:tRNA ligase n=1 Tax=Entomortierella chlamydospora TaxID=101097 RepID=A0A9P6T277_9FUNG|nr:hypothetical protein BGZ80_005155 [Entomortierella chlamydospora]
MDQLTSDLQQVRIQENASQQTRANRSLEEEVANADALTRTLHSYLEHKTKASSGRKRNLVSATKFELDLEKQRNPSTTNKGGSTKKKHDINTITVTSWKMNEFEYVKGTLPTLARGLFTYQDPSQERSSATTQETSKSDSQDNSDKGIHRILLRGYDKFFNVGEVNKTKPAYIAEHTEGPYEVTLKENGCIIFMSGLPPHLVGPQGGCVVSSKHSLGFLEHKEGSNQPDVSHAFKGREWLEKSLAAKGKTLQEFGLWLWNNNLTAVAELCDDSFEEHVLQYPAERAGLYLHGLNRNTADFQTLPSERVQEVAKEWGLIQTDYVTFDSHQEVMNFAEKVRNAGEYDNRAVEGFVVRCKTKEDGNTFFFKIKYDEPYLMYREWREITKRLWSIEVKKAAGKANAGAGPMTLRMRYPLTKFYVEFVQDLMKKQPELFSGYNKNQGIIAIRDMFVKEWESKSAKDKDSLLDISTVSANRNATTEEGFQRTVLIPIATIGCGKTTVSVALSKLFGWKHVSSDDFHHFKKSSGQKFINEVVAQLKNNTVVIADRNNFQFGHRQRIIDAVLAKYPKTRFVALYWSHDDQPISHIRDMAVDRVKNRGSNHQCMTPEYCPDYEIIIQTFLRSFEPLNPMTEPDSNFSYVVEARVGEDSLTFVKKIIEEFAIPTLGAGGIGNHSIPSQDEVKEAVRYALEDWKPQRVITGEVTEYYKAIEAKRASAPELSDQNASSSSTGAASTNGTVVSGKVKKAREPKYFAVSLEYGSVLSFLGGLFGETSKPKSSPEWTQLGEQFKSWKESHRIGPRQHVTLIHLSAKKDPTPKKAQRAEDLWKVYTEEIANAAPPSVTSTVSSPAASSAAVSTSSISFTSPQVEGESGFTTVAKKSGRGNRARRAAGTKDVQSATVVSSASSTSSISMESPDLLANVVVDHIIWTERIMALRVTSAKRVKNGKPYESTNTFLHVTVGTAGDHVKPFESNEILRQWSTKTKHGAPGSSGTTQTEIFSIKLDTPRVFTGHLKAMLF